jgi:trimeric autotransporter adhesin
MKTRLQKLFIAVASLAILNSQLSALHAQNTDFTYQGRVTDNGTNFTGAGQFKFALVTSTNANRTATATANAPSSGFITGYTVTSGGSGYVTAPAVTIFGGGGTGAAAHANLTGGAVSSLSVDSTGNGNYTSAPTVLIAPPPDASYTTYWSNDGTSVAGSEPSGAVNVPVNNGLFTVVLGENMTAIPASLFNQPNLQLRIWFNDGVHGFAALDPAQNLTPAPYASFANTASNLVNGLRVQPDSTYGAPNVIGGSAANYVSNNVIGATIAGGGATANYEGPIYSNSVTASFGTVSGGYGNTAGPLAAVGGGYQNTASADGATVSGGSENTASGDAAMVGGGAQNTASGQFATISGGEFNNASGRDATVVGGLNSIASGNSATVAGGQGNKAAGTASFAAGQGAQALHDNTFVWSDGSPGTFASTAINQFSVRAAGGIQLAGDVQLSGGAAYHNLSLSGGNSSGYLYGSYPFFGDGIHLSYNFYADANGQGHIINTGGGTSRITLGYGSVGIYVGDVNLLPGTQRLLADTTHVEVNGTFNNNSDRNAKQGFAPVNSSQILDKVLQLPVSEWSYKDDPTTRHLGPVAQDFRSLFEIGTDEKHIAPIDEGGVAFAAIQGLNEKLELGARKSDDRIQKLEAENAELKERLDALEKMIRNQKSN